jgi:hypothetical protein
MKTIQVTDKQYEFLTKLSEQVCREVVLNEWHITADPVFCVMQKKRIYIGDSTFTDGDGWEYLSDGDSYTANEVFEHIEEYRRDNPKDKSDASTLRKQLGYYRSSYIDVDQFVGAYLTKEAAEHHIKTNAYHYDRPFVYVNSFWRNWEMQGIRDLLLSLNFEPTPSDGEKQVDKLRARISHLEKLCYDYYTCKDDGSAIVADVEKALENI